MPKTTTEPSDPVTYIEAPTKEEFLLAQDEFLDLVGDDSDAAFHRRSKLKDKLRKWGPHAGCGAEPMVEIEVPTAHDGISHFKINRKTYHGKCFVPACEARQLAHMIESNRRIDRERFREQIKHLPAHEVSAKTSN